MIKIVILTAAVSYVAWGIIYHAVHRSLHLKIVLEYLSLAILGIAVSFSVINYL